MDDIQDADEVRSRDFVGVRVDRRRYERVTFIDCDLSEIETDHATFVDCSFRRCRLNGSTHDGTAYTSCTFVDVDFFGATFTGCDLTEADLRDADLRGSLLYSVDPLSTRLDGARVTVDQAIQLARNLGLSIES